MTQAYNVVDADGHILEPLTLWDEYIDPDVIDLKALRDEFLANLKRSLAA